MFPEKKIDPQPRTEILEGQRIIFQNESSRGSLSISLARNETKGHYGIQWKLMFNRELSCCCLTVQFIITQCKKKI